MNEELIDTLRLCESNTHCKECPYYNRNKQTEECKKLLVRAADAIEQLEAAQRWIPVTEEPPLKVGDDCYNGYLVYANGCYEVADYTTDKFDNVPYFHVDGEYEPGVTHYMPLPEPPEEEV